jgi:histidine triad (HIT) family protein
MSCFGCQLANQTVDAKVVFEDEFIVCMLDIYPLNEGHTLILPKQHYKELDHNRIICEGSTCIKWC